MKGLPALMTISLKGYWRWDVSVSWQRSYFYHIYR